MKVVLFVFVGVFAAASAAESAKEQVIAKTRNLISGFPTVEQAKKVWDKVAQDIYNMKTTKETANDMVETVLSAVTGEQLAKGLQIYKNLQTELGSDLNSVIDRAGTVASNNLQPLRDQVQAKVKKMITNKKTKAQCIDQEFAMINTFFTADRVKTILTRIKGKMTAKQWHAIRKHLADVVYFDKYGL
ncbi:hypothetical protein AAVH_15825 [Aphelenchoides avenae]|nr:hypothetical protein AAVH_15825 [Aphelenchus avenae]